MYDGHAGPNVTKKLAILSSDQYREYILYGAYILLKNQEKVTQLLFIIRWSAKPKRVQQFVSQHLQVCYNLLGASLL